MPLYYLVWPIQSGFNAFKDAKIVLCLAATISNKVELAVGGGRKKKLNEILNIKKGSLQKYLIPHFRVDENDFYHVINTYDTGFKGVIPYRKFLAKPAY